MAVAVILVALILFVAFMAAMGLIVYLAVSWAGRRRDPATAQAADGREAAPVG